MAKNCWEFKKCGREKDHSCPVVVENAGRSCWYVVGTMCNGKVEGTFAQKIGDCQRCEFYIKVNKGTI